MKLEEKFGGCGVVSQLYIIIVQRLKNSIHMTEHWNMFHFLFFGLNM